MSLSGVRGERHGNSKLTENQVREIFRRVHNGERQKKIAFDYGVDERVVSSIKVGKRWKHLNLIDTLSYAYIYKIPMREKIHE